MTTSPVTQLCLSVLVLFTLASCGPPSMNNGTPPANTLSGNNPPGDTMSNVPPPDKAAGSTKSDRTSEWRTQDKPKSYTVERNLSSGEKETLCYGYPGCGFSESSAGSINQNIAYKEIVKEGTKLPTTNPTVEQAAPDPTAKKSTHGGYFTCVFKLARSRSEILSASGFSASAAARYKIVRGSTNFSNTRHELVQQQSISICVESFLTFGREVFAMRGKQLTLTSEAEEYLQKNGKAEFCRLFGTHYVDSGERGARFVLVFTFSSHSKEHLDRILGEVGVSAKSVLANVDAKSTFEKLCKKRSEEFAVSVDVFGANVDFESAREVATSFLTLSEPKADELEAKCKKLLDPLKRETADFVVFSATPHPVRGPATNVSEEFWKEASRRYDLVSYRLAICHDLEHSERMMKASGDSRSYHIDAAAVRSQLDDALADIRSACISALAGEEVGTEDLPVCEATGAAVDKWVSEQANWSFSDWLALSRSTSSTFGVFVTPPQRAFVEAIRKKYDCDDTQLYNRISGESVLEIEYQQLGRQECDPTPAFALNRLEVLALRNVNLQHLPAAEVMSRLTNLHTLDLSGNPLRGETREINGTREPTGDSPTLARILRIPNLSHLVLRGCFITDSDLASLSPLSDQLVALDIGAYGEANNVNVVVTPEGAGGNNFEDKRGWVAYQPAQKVNCITRWPLNKASKLKYLNLGSNVALTDISGLSSVLALERLDLSNTAIDSVSLLSAIGGLKLSTLNLSRCRNIRKLSTVETIVREQSTLREIVITSLGSPLPHLDGVTSFQVAEGTEGGHERGLYPQWGYNNPYNVNIRDWQKRNRLTKLEELRQELNEGRAVKVAILAEISGFGGKMTGSEDAVESTRFVQFALTSLYTLEGAR